MNTHIKLATPLTLIATLLLGACASTGGTEASPAAANKAPEVKPAQVLVTVNGREIGKSALPRLDPSKPGSEEQALDEIIARELIWQDFNSKQLGNDPAIQEQLQNSLRVAYSQVAADLYIKSIKISDDELRKTYDAKKQALVSTQYQLKHILLEDEAKAKQVIAKLGKGENFDKLAKKHSKDDNSKNQGGELGWVDPRALGPNFEHALSKMKKGDVASEPLQTQFGWHVILLEDVKTKEAPALDVIKDKLLNNMRMEKFQAYIQTLKAQAKITKANAPK